MSERLQISLPKVGWVDVETRIVTADRCCGCGVCEAICPVEGCITMQFDVNKQYVPVVDHDICINCRLCLRVCPDDPEADAKIDELFKASHPDLKDNQWIGPTLSCYVGHVSAELDRRASASGGVLTAVLEELLDSGEVDAVALAGESNYRVTGRFFKSKLAASVEEVRANRGSKYYPIEYSQLLKVMKSDDRRYAVVAIPCGTIAIRKAQRYNRRLRENMRYILTPVCGHNVSASYTQYLLLTNGIDPSSVARLTYRDKRGTLAANDYNLAVQYRNKRGETEVKRLGFHRSNVGKTWTTYMLAMNKCLYCTDVAGELSDASFADAWLPQYVEDVRGTSLVILRDAELDQLIRQMVKAGKLQLAPTSSEAFIASQKTSLHHKKELIKSRIRWQKLFNRDFPDYGVDWNKTSPWEGLAEIFRLWLHVHLSRWLYRHGLLTKLGTERFLALVDAPINWPVGMVGRVRRLLKG